jgi:hypothetical protein
MSEHDGARDSQSFQRLVDEFCLGFRRPDHVARTVAVPETGAVERDDAVLSRGHLQEPARFEVLDHAAVTVQ